MNRLFNNDWNLRIGEVELFNNQGKKYTLVVGYDSDDNFLRGTWLDVIECNGVDEAPPELIEPIKKQVKRLGALKIFA